MTGAWPILARERGTLPRWPPAAASPTWPGRARPMTTRTVVELGACGHGPRGADLAEQLAGHLRAWDREHRHGPGPVLTVHPAGRPATDLPPGHVIRKRHTTMVLSWPDGRPVSPAR